MLAVLMVDADAPTGGDGLTWATAYSDLQPALTQAAALNADADPANDIDSIWIAEGTYKPSARLNEYFSTSVSFSLVDDVTLYGGFAGGETTLSERDWSAHVVTLSGEIGTPGSIFSKANTVVYCSDGVESGLDGVLITGGNANLSTNDYPQGVVGGGIYNAGTLTLTNSIVLGNSAAFGGGGIYNAGVLTLTNSEISDNLTAEIGGGIWNESGTLSITNSTVSKNIADNDGGGIFNEGILDLAGSTLTNNAGESGGALCCSGSGTLAVMDCTFSDNSADRAAGIWSDFSFLEVTNSIFSGNSALSCGGIFNDDSGTLLVTNCEFLDNSADSGGGIHNDGVVIITDCLFHDNDGSGIYNDGELSLTNSTLTGNTNSGINNSSSGTLSVSNSTLSDNDGSGISSRGALTVTDSTFAGNSTSLGGGIYSTGTLTVVNSTFAGNSASGSGGGIYHYGSGSDTLTITNCTISRNSADTGGGIYLSLGSTQAALNNTIVAGNNGNMGPNAHLSGTLLASHNLIGDGSGQSTLVNGVDGNLVGTASSPIDPGLSDWTQFDNGLWGFYLLPGSPALDAGDDSLALDPEGLPLAEDIRGDTRIQNGTVDLGAVEGATPGAPSQIYTVASLDNTIANDGILTFLEAFEAANRNQPVGDAPAGSFIEQDVIEFVNGLSGTVFLEDGELAIVGDLRIEGPGAELLTFQANGQDRVFSVWLGVLSALDGVAITGGLADDGGGICNSGTLTVTNSAVWGNAASENGGGIYNTGTLTVTNSALSGNSARSNGGGISNFGTLTITNSTLSGNLAELGGGVHSYGSLSTATLNNTIVADNKAAYGPDVYHSSYPMSGSNNLIGDGSGQSSLVDGVNGNQVGTSLAPIDPLLSDWTQMDSGGWGYYLLPGSPALDAGDNSVALDPSGQPLTQDIRGNARVQNSTVDVGAVEGTTAGSPAQTYVVTSLDDTIASDGILTFVEAFEASKRNQPVGDAPAGSFSEQDIIEFADRVSGTVLVEDGEFKMIGSLKIEGPGAELLTFQANGQNRVFLVSASASVALDKIAVTGSSADNSGGIQNCGSLTVTNCTFTGNSAPEGGGIGNYATLAVTDSTLSGNSATEGGGIFNSGTLTVTNSALSDNSATERGGGIYNSQTLTVTNSTLQGNSAAEHGGGIYNYRTLTVANSVFQDNSASELGGGIYSFGTLTITGATLWDNSASSGGGIFWGGTLTMVNSMLWGNSATEKGGGLYGSSSLTLTNSTVSGNAALTGGGIWIGESPYSERTLNNAIVANNSASTGPDIACTSGNLSGSHNLIGNGSDQTALVDDVDGNQVGTSAAPIDPLLSDWTELDNGLWGYYLLPGSPALDAGDNGLALDPSGQPLAQDILRNARVQNGTVDMGAVEGATPSVPAQIYTITSLDNTIATDGVLTFLEAFEASNRNQPVGDAPAGSFGEQDVITFAEGLQGTILMDNGEFSVIGSLAIMGPGTELLTFNANGQNRLFRVRQYASLFLDRVTLTGGSAEDGGAILNNSHHVTIAHCALSGNSADRGGAVYNDAGTLTVTDSTLSGNSARFGGAAYNNSGALVIARSMLSENSSDDDGGGIYNANSGTLSVSDSTLTDNSAYYFGGGICNHDAGTLIVTNSILTDNTAYGGGGLANSGESTITDSQISNNSTRGDGGGSHNSGTLNLIGSIISENSAGNLFKKDGGGVYNVGVVTIVDSTVSSNSAKSGAGAYNRDNAIMTIVGTEFSDNTAGSIGGGIRNSFNSILTVTDSTFSGNWGLVAGGINNANGAVTITNSIFFENTAEYRGGAINNDSGALIIRNSTVSNNSAEDDYGSGYGGGIYLSDSSTTVTLDNTIVAGNSAVSGADIYHAEGPLSGAYNLIGNGSGQTNLVGGVDGNQVGTASSPIDPMLDAWGVPLSGSPAINGGSNVLAGDGQGNPLLVDLGGRQRVIYGTVDIGAYEYGLPGDASEDYQVGPDDAAVLAIHWLSSDDVSWDDGDFNADGRVDDLDASIMAANWGSSVPEGSGTARPETPVIVERTKLVGPRRLETTGLLTPARTPLALAARPQLPVEGVGMTQTPLAPPVRTELRKTVQTELRATAHDLALAELFARPAGQESTPARRKIGPVRPVVDWAMMER
ncbi:MAG: right-handed parallel beta-helix repeat-containing protein [Pirellulales bacterium]|nr:right-handed parallel beta-helix repeat-containing protein [Pirellulales bacterium]